MLFGGCGVDQTNQNHFFESAGMIENIMGNPSNALKPNTTKGLSKPLNKLLENPLQIDVQPLNLPSKADQKTAIYPKIAEYGELQPLEPCLPSNSSLRVPAAEPAALQRSGATGSKKSKVETKGQFGVERDRAGLGKSTELS